MTDIKQKRIEAKMTQFELAKKCGVSLNTIVKWEAGISRPSELNLHKLKKALEASK